VPFAVEQYSIVRFTLNGLQFESKHAVGTNLRTAWQQRIDRSPARALQDGLSGPLEDSIDNVKFQVVLTGRPVEPDYTPSVGEIVGWSQTDMAPARAGKRKRPEPMAWGQTAVFLGFAMPDGHVLDVLTSIKDSAGLKTLRLAHVKFDGVVNKDVFKSAKQTAKTMKSRLQNDPLKRHEHAAWTLLQAMLFKGEELLLTVLKDEAAANAVRQTRKFRAVVDKVMDDWEEEHHACARLASSSSSAP
jgi:hypothetical protein